MNPGDVAAWCVGAALMGAAAVVFYAKARELFLVRMPRDAHRRWTADLQADAEALIRAELHVAELQCQIAERIPRMPENFVAPAFLASRLGYAVERAVVEEAKRRGFYSPEVLADLQRVDALPGQDQPQNERPITLAPTANTASTAWEGGRLVPFKKGP